MRILVLSWSAYGGGRARALLSLVEYCHDSGFDVTVVTGEQSWPDHRLASHHGIDPAGEWHRVGWRENATKTTRHIVDRHAPDAVVSFDTILNTKARGLDVPTVGYCRTQIAVGLDEYWAPSKAVADRFTSELVDRGEPPCHPVYPVWYIDSPADVPSFEDRPIDVLVHGRKARETGQRLNPEYNVLLANRFSAAELRSMYRQTKAFVFPRPERFEPLGLMPIEAAAMGCRVAVPENSGVAEIMPDHATEYPLDHVESILDATTYTHPELPASPTDPVSRLQKLKT